MHPTDRNRPTREQSAVTERRSHRRYAVDMPVRFSSELMEFEGQAQLVEGQVGDISQGGLFIRSQFLEVPGTQVHLYLRVPHTHEPLCLEGQVAWVAHSPPAGPGMGVKIKGKPLAQVVLDKLLATPV